MHFQLFRNAFLTPKTKVYFINLKNWLSFAKLKNCTSIAKARGQDSSATLARVFQAFLYVTHLLFSLLNFTVKVVSLEYSRCKVQQPL